MNKMQDVIKNLLYATPYRYLSKSASCRRGIKLVLLEGFDRDELVLK